MGIFYVKKTTSQFIEEAQQVHGDKYDYSKTNYVNAKTKVCIICPEHGEFWQMPRRHVYGCGCPKCAGKGKTTDEIINDFRKVHGDKYDYSKVIYKGALTKVCIICPIHGEFWQTPSSHINKRGCPQCGGTLKYTTQTFIEKAKEIHGDKYDYSKVEYVNCNTKVCIICPIHGEFWQSPHDHLNGFGCKFCGIERSAASSRKDTMDFITKSHEIHGDKYDYSKVEYVNCNTPVCIICPKHGEFWQIPYVHLAGMGCYKCGREVSAKKQTMTKDEFIRRAQLIHNNKYDYTKVEYKNNNTHICIICPEHGEFWQTPNKHLNGQGCPKCNLFKLENIIMAALEREKIDYELKKHFIWLKYDKLMHLDFYLPKYKISVECQGGQHYTPIEIWGGTDGLKKNQIRDKLKSQLCEKHGIKILHFTEKQYQKYQPEAFTDVNELLNEIKKHNS